MCPAANGSEDGRDEDAQDIGDEAPIVCQAVAQSEGKREHLLTDGHCGKDPIYQVSSGVGHPAAATGRTKAAAFTFPPVLRLRSKRGKLLLEISSLIRFLCVHEPGPESAVHVTVAVKVIR